MPARSNINEVRLTPEETNRQQPGDSTIEVSPEPETGLTTSRDLFGNLVHAFEVEHKHTELSVVSKSVVTTSHPFEDSIQQIKSLPTDDFSSVKMNDELYPYTTDSQYVKKTPEIWREALDQTAEVDATWGVLMESLNHYVFDSCQWTEQLIHRATSAAEVQKTRQGTCQDFAHLLIGYSRALGIPARYISGYLYDPGLEDDQLAAQFIGASVSHAWVEFYTPGHGWIGIDPTNRQWVDENYVSVARGRDYGDVAPVRGSLLGGGPKRSLDVKVVVTRES